MQNAVRYFSAICPIALLVAVLVVAVSSRTVWGGPQDEAKASGSLTVKIKPKDARQEGARWRVDGGAWQKSGRTISGLSVGKHTIAYKSLPEWDTPPEKERSVNDAQTTTLTGKYRQSIGVTETFMLPGDVALEMVRIPYGSFMMGRTTDELGSNANESPRHEVEFQKEFWISLYEVTQAQWLAVLENNPSFYTGDLNRPVESVSWDDIQVFLSKLNEYDFAAFRLPSEAEWEYACRAGTATRYYWGDDSGVAEIGDYAWHSANSANSTHPVGQKQPNAWGVYDMSGNVSEWCEDWNHADYTGAPADGSAWISPTGTGRMLRGGSKADTASDCRSAVRGFATQTNSNSNIGFRLVK